MSEKYNFTAIEKKWQQYWDEHNTFRAGTDYSKPKFYALVEFPYPSGQGLHIGHPRPYTAMDIVSRKRRLEGYNVLFPMGWDAFGLPTENYAIKNKIHPAVVTKKNIAHFKDQLKMLGLSFDWEREVDTTDPEYYRWTQWIFLEMFKKGLAYKKEMAVNWCTSCKVVLANEEVVGGCCERCGGEVIRKVKSQWMLKITEYAQRLLDDLSEVDYLDRIKSTQINWIGRSTGAEVNFGSTAGDILTVYTTRPDTLFGATYMVIAPEHPYIEKWADRLENIEEIKAYQEKAAKKSDRIAAEGLVTTYVSEDKKIGAVVEVNAETDFVAKNEEFRSFVADVARQVVEKNPATVEELLEQPSISEEGKTVGEVLTGKIATIGENMSIRRFERFETTGLVESYIHGDGKIGVLVEIEGGNSQFAKDICMQIAAAKPEYLDRDSVPSDRLQKEMEILKAQAMNEGKPAEIAEKMVQGRIGKFYGEICLVEQEFVKNPDIKISKLAEENNAKIIRFARFEKGEGLQKREENFAEEVMSFVK